MFKRQAGATIAATEAEAAALATEFNARFGSGAARTFADTQTLGELSRSYCFSPETLVSTSAGLKRLGEVNPGEHVHAFEFAAGDWVLSEVVHRHDNRYDGEMVTVHVAGTTIEVTANHPFWVERGERLTGRARPGHIDPGEDEGKSLAGRWVNSQDLLPNDTFVCRDGLRTRVDSIARWTAVGGKVCNLTIRNQHSFAVGDFGILVHNTGWCNILELAGRAKPAGLETIAKRNNWRIHGHHIVQRTVPAQYASVSHIATEQAMLRTAGLTRSQQAAWYIGKSQEILRLSNIPVLVEEHTAEAFARAGAPLHNLAWAINGNGTHTLETMQNVYQRLADVRGDRDGVIRVLRAIADIFESGRLPQNVAR